MVVMGAPICVQTSALRTVHGSSTWWHRVLRYSILTQREFLPTDLIPCEAPSSAELPQQQ